MDPAQPGLLVVNGGSSSIRFAIYESAEAPLRRLRGKVDRIGMGRATLSVDDPTRAAPLLLPLKASDPPGGGGVPARLARDPAGLRARGRGGASRGARHEARRAGAGHPDAARGTPPDHAVRSGAPARGSRTDGGVRQTASEASPGCMFRHRVPSHPAADRAAAADSPALCREGDRALRLPWPFLRVPHGGTRTPRSSGGQKAA
jgi:hypothetical protein